MITVQVRGNGEQAIRTLRQKMQHNQLFNKIKRSAFYESPSEKKARKKQESRRRRKKNHYRRQYDE